MATTVTDRDGFPLDPPYYIVTEGTPIRDGRRDLGDLCLDHRAARPAGRSGQGRCIGPRPRSRSNYLGGPAVTAVARKAGNDPFRVINQQHRRRRWVSQSPLERRYQLTGWAGNNKPSCVLHRCALTPGSRHSGIATTDEVVADGLSSTLP
jgi:hypothetical protein